MKKGDIKAAAENWSTDRYQLAPGHDAARQALYEALVNSPHNLRYPGQLEIRLPPAIERLAEMRVPTLILVGESDIPDVHAYSGAIEAGIPGARRDVIADAGHLMALDQPERLSRIIIRFVQKSRALDLPPERLRACAGLYQFPSAIHRFAVKNDRLVLRISGERDVILFPKSSNSFFALTGGGAEFEFTAAANNKITGVRWKEWGMVRHGRRVLLA